jgi:hypothetical protein
MSEPEIFARIRSYEVSVWPDEIECMDSEVWKITVAYRGHGMWAVVRGGDGSRGIVLGVQSDLHAWHIEPRPSERDDDWLAGHRFPLDAALDLARVHAPKVTINGMTALEVLAWHRERHPDGNCHD